MKYLRIISQMIMACAVSIEVLAQVKRQSKLLILMNGANQSVKAVSTSPALFLDFRNGTSRLTNSGNDVTHIYSSLEDMYFSKGRS